MFKLDDSLIVEYVTESRENLSTVESDLLAIEEDGAEIDEERVNRVFRIVHTIKGASGFFDLHKIGELSHQAENVLALIRSGKMVPTADCVQVLLRATDRLNELFEEPETSNEADIADMVAELTELYAESRPPAEASPAGESNDARGPAQERAYERDGPLRVLLAEDDFACRLLLQTFLGRYSECHAAVNGREAIEAFRHALESGQRYDLICMDIMMPEVDGREAVRRIRALEQSRGIRSTAGVKIFMTTTVQQVREVVLCFKELCDAYLMKPIDLEQLVRQMKAFQLVK